MTLLCIYKLCFFISLYIENVHSNLVGILYHMCCTYTCSIFKITIRKCMEMTMGLVLKNVYNTCMLTDVTKYVMRHSAR